MFHMQLLLGEKDYSTHTQTYLQIYVLTLIIDKHTSFNRSWNLFQFLLQ